MKRVLLFLVPVAAAAALAAAAHGGSGRPSVTVRVDDHRLTAPRTVPAGFVDVRIVTRGLVHHHLAFWHLNRGITVARFIAVLKKSNGDPFKIATAVGGNGPMLPGTIQTTMRFMPGTVVAADIVEGPTTRITSFVVGASTATTSPPRALGTIINRGFRFVLPSGFGRPGIYRFENTDGAAHDGDIFPLARGKHAADLVRWLKGGGKGAPPVDFARPLGGPGAIGAHWSSWFRLRKLPAGHYVLACFLPDEQGMLHAAMGMVSEFSVD